MTVIGRESAVGPRSLSLVKPSVSALLDRRREPRDSVHHELARKRGYASRPFSAQCNYNVVSSTFFSYYSPPKTLISCKSDRCHVRWLGLARSVDGPSSAFFQQCDDWVISVRYSPGWWASLPHAHSTSRTRLVHSITG